ncbi:MAG: hypothetical protein J7578_15470 [Chitinophagaceae bacterium]|nr:hypothetical protein [Chitinophagaceae bacterium]
MEKIEKTPARVAEQMENWFLKYYSGESLEYDGTGPFILFKHLKPGFQHELTGCLDIVDNEIPVLILFIQHNQYIICTTERFIHTGPEAESIYYADFNRHQGFISWLPEDRKPGMPNMKAAGAFAEFGLKKKDGMVTIWVIPTGKPGFAFWNVTNRFEFVGRKYKIIK